MKTEKSNIEYLKDIIVIFKAQNPAQGEEAFEFLEAIEEDLIDKEDEIIKLGREIDELEKMNHEAFENIDFVGLDTINWSLDKRNIKIEQQMETFIESLRKQNCVGVMEGTPLF